MGGERQVVHVILRNAMGWGWKWRITTALEQGKKEEKNTPKKVKRMRCAVFSFLFFGWQTKVNIIALENWSEEQDLTVRTVKYTTVPIQASGGGRRLYMVERGKGSREDGRKEVGLRKQMQGP